MSPTHTHPEVDTIGSNALTPHNVLNKDIVLVLNKNWRAVNVVSPVAAFNQLFVGAATVLLVDDHCFQPVSIDEWLKLPVRDQDWSVGTSRGRVRVPTVIILTKYDKIHKKRVRFSKRAVFERDGGRDQYTGEFVPLERGNLDHVIPKSRGGKKSWDNIVWTAKPTNSKKSNKTPEEAGLQLIRKPVVPTEVLLPEQLIQNKHGIKEWDMVLKKPKGK